MCDCNECMQDLYRKKASKELRKKISTVDNNGKINHFSKMDILIGNLVNNATKGNKNSIEALIKIGVFDKN